jgi:hypothetical protein
MLTETECLTKAADFIDQASLSQVESFRVAYLALAAGWQRVAEMAAFQDGWHLNNGAVI